ncbi:response regulator transcription factor [Marinomonas sp.]|uniref:response regulator transcription factor n=1 Tax=Marinomonas sp. TaxID=1904862 RepID=UPI003BAC5CC3
MARIYFVEDNEYLLSDGLLWLKSEGYDAKGVSSAEEFYALMSEQKPDLVLLDWNLPEEDGLSIANKLKNTPETHDILIIFVTSRNTINDKLSGLDRADAYLTKPFDYRELLAMIRALLRRTAIHRSQLGNPVLAYVPSQKNIRMPNGEEIDITEKENIILQVLLSNPNDIVSHKLIAEALNEPMSFYEKNRTEALVSRLRNKLKTGEDNPIRSFRNKGYQLMIKIESIEE